jgi:hypothetical protein
MKVNKMPALNPSFPKFACALAALCLLACACSTKEPAALTQPQVAELLQKWDAAQMNGDIEGVAACLSKKLQYKMTYKLFRTTDTDAGDYRKYIAGTKRGFSIGGSISTERKMSAIGVEPDGQSATVLGEVHDALLVEGKLYRIVLTGTMTVGLEDGRAVITAIDQVVTHDYEGRQPFQTD